MVRDDVPLPVVCLNSEDEEREHLIREYGDNMMQAYADGNRQAAEQWLALQDHELTLRSASKVAQLEAERGLGARP